MKSASTLSNDNGATNPIRCHNDDDDDDDWDDVRIRRSMAAFVAQDGAGMENNGRLELEETIMVMVAGGIKVRHNIK